MIRLGITLPQGSGIRLASTGWGGLECCTLKEWHISRPWAGKALQTIREQKEMALAWKTANKPGAVQVEAAQNSTIQSLGFEASKIWVPVLLLHLPAM